MDLVASARRVIVTMEHTTKNGEPELIPKCTLPITGLKVVDTVITDLGFFRFTAQGFFLEELSSRRDCRASAPSHVSNISNRFRNHNMAKLTRRTFALAVTSAAGLLAQDKPREITSASVPDDPAAPHVSEGTLPPRLPFGSQIDFTRKDVNSQTPFVPSSMSVCCPAHFQPPTTPIVNSSSSNLPIVSFTSFA